MSTVGHKGENVAFGYQIATEDLGGQYDNWNPDGLLTCHEILCYTNVDTLITGIEAPPGRLGGFHILINGGSANLTLSPFDSFSYANNQFSLADYIVLAPGSSAIIIYNRNSNFWNVASVYSPYVPAPFDDYNAFMVNSIYGN